MANKKKWEIFPRRYGFFPYIFLVYLLLPILQVAKESGLKQFIGFLLVFIFLLSYQQLYSQMEKESFKVWLIAQIVLVLVLSAFYDPNLLFMGYFPANFIGYYTNQKYFRIFYYFFVIALTFPLLLSWHHINFNSLIFFFPFFLIMLISPFGIRSMNRRMELERELDFANEQIDQLVKREERMRIARDLHDTLGHTLSLLTLKSQIVGKMVKIQPEEAIKEAREIEEVSRAALRQVRELVSDMRSVTIREGLIEVQKTLTAAKVHLESSIELEEEEIPLLLQNILSLCLKEAVTNIVRHSGASICRINIFQQRGEVVLSVEDNGSGFHHENAKGNGLKGMKERLELVQGTFRISCEQGTTLHIVIPIIQKERQKEEVL